MKFAFNSCYDVRAKYIGAAASCCRIIPIVQIFLDSMYILYDNMKQEH